GPERKTVAARAVCAVLSAVTRCTRTLVSTATTPSLQALGDRPLHVCRRMCRPAIAGTTDDIFQARGGKGPGRAEEDAFRHAFDDELGAFRPSVGFADCFRQDQLAFGRRPGRVHLSVSSSS